LALVLADGAAWLPRLVHGELSPAQVMVRTAPGQEPQVWLRLPMQLAGLLGDAAPAEPERPAAAADSPAARYCAPECLAGSRPTPSSDVYALAAMLFELLGGDPGQAALAVRNGCRLPPLPPSSPVGPALQEALTAALHPNPNRRPIASELARCLGLAAEPGSPPPVEEKLRELRVPAPGGTLRVELAEGGNLHLYSLQLDRLANKGPLPLPLSRVSGLLPAPVSVSLYRDTLAIELLAGSDSGQGRSRLYPEGAQAGTARLFLTADGTAFELGSRTQNRLQRIEYQALTDSAQDTAELLTLALRLRLPRALRAAVLWTRDLRSGDLHVCCAQLAE
jgi:serine/threonine protein kinase